jgi:integrase
VSTGALRRYSLQLSGSGGYKTFASYKETLHRYIVPALGTLQVRDVEPEDIEAMLQRAAAKSTKGELSANTLRIIRATAHQMFKRAIKKLRLDSGNPCKDLDVPLGKLSQEDRTRSVRERVMSYEQLARCLRAAKQHCTRRDHMVFLTLAETGARPSEVLALRWTDVDIDARTVCIERAVTLGSLIKPTKTKAIRTLPLADALLAWRRRVDRVAARRKLLSPEYIFPSRMGGPLQPKPLGRSFRALLRKAGLPPALTLYSFRHTYCSQLPQDDMSAIADRLTAARQAIRGRNDDLNDDFAKTNPVKKAKKSGK